MRVDWLPVPLHHLALRVADRARRRYWKWRGRPGRGVRIIAVDEAGRVLLVRHSYGSRNWMPPGGGVGGAESMADAAVRELLEETGCRLLDPFALVDTMDDPHQTGGEVVAVAGRASGSLAIDGREIVEAGFFATDALPEPISSEMRAGLPGWAAGALAGKAG